MQQPENNTPSGQQPVKDILQSGKDNPANGAAAHEAAEADMTQDPDFATEPETGDELDEGELARLEGEK